jgi:amino acid transporter
VLTGAVHYEKFENVGDPLAFIFEESNLNIAWMQRLVAICAVIARTSVLLVFQMGQPRIWMSMSRDGLLPPIFQTIHKQFKTPSFATIVTGVVVALPIIFSDKTFVLDFTSIGTLFAFVLVCGGVLLIPKREKEPGKFNLPYVNGKYLFGGLLIAVTLFVFYKYPTYFPDMFKFDFSANESYVAKKSSFMDLATPQISLIVFWISLYIIAFYSYIKNFSLIPLLGLASCMYLLTGMTKTNWAWFLAWLALGLVVYFIYGKNHSKLSKG